ncbi:MAG TPA: protein kinase [Marmoricola sp.]
MEPELIGSRYRVRSPVGRGGMGTVWLCEDEVLRRDVAVKQVGLLPGESVTDSARALREARTSAALSHRNVVTVFDVVEESGTIYLVMEYVPSRSLAELIEEEGPLDPGRVARIGAQVADGLAAAHAVGIAHRDVKPGNVLVTEDGTAKIGDFGIARVTTEPALTQSGFVTGTPSYFSPELARGARPDPSADVWALGATLYAAVEGRSMYEKRANPVAVLHDIATTLPPRPSRAGALEQPLMRMLDRDPEQRWSMATAAQRLQKLADELSDEGTREYTREPLLVGPPPADRSQRPAVPTDPTGPTGPGPSSGQGTARPRHRRRWYLALAAALLVLVGGIFIATLLGRQRGQSPSPAASPQRHASTQSQGTGGRSTPHQDHQQPARRPNRSTSGKVGFLKTYYSTVPGNLDAGWSMLGPHERTVGRSSYDKFWGSIASVDVSHIVTSPGSQQADVTLTYHYRDGRVVDERQRLTLVRAADGPWRIDNDRVLSSTSHG